MASRRRGAYLIYLVRANKPMRPRRLHRLSDLDGHGTDLLAATVQHLNDLGGRLHNLSDDQGFRVREVDRAGRTLFIRIRQGPLGAPGEFWDMDLEAAQELTDRQPALSELRGLLAVPTGAHFCLLFVERIARRHIRDILRDFVLKPISQETGLVVRSAAFADGADWRTFLADKQPLRVGELLARRSSADSAAEADETVVKIAVEGAGIRAAGRGEALKERLFGRADREGEHLRLLVRASTMEDDEELQEQIKELEGQHDGDAEITQQLRSLIPLDTGSFEHRRFEVAFGDNRPERSFILERGSLPQFVYELGSDRLSDSVLRQTWVHHAERIFSTYEQAPPRTWARRRTANN